MTASVSVVIPTHNRLHLLAQTLHTVLAQDVDLEVIVVDEASSDGTAEWLAGLRDRRVATVRHDEPRGLPTARNVGLSASQGDWVAFVDDDDLWLPDKLAAQLEAARQTGFRWAYGGALDITSEPRLLRVTLPTAAGSARLPWVNAVPGGGSNVVAERKLLEEAGGFDAGLSSAEDWDMWIRLWQLGAPAVVPVPVLAYRIHPGNMSRKVDDMLAAVEVLDRRYRGDRGGEGLDWDDAFRWIGASALRAGDMAAARRVAFAAMRARHPGSWRRLSRALVPLAPRQPVAEADERRTVLDRIRPRAVVPWWPGTESWIRETLQVLAA